MNKFDYVKIFSLENNGKVYFIYSDKFNIFFFCYDVEECKFYKITTDKYFNIEYIDEIYIPNQYSKFKDIKLFKPFKHNITNEYVFPGIIITEEGDYKFNIEPNNNLKILEKTEYINKAQLSLLTCLNNFNVISHIQKGDKIYLIAYDQKYLVYVYGVVDIKKDKFVLMYSLYTDEGEIVPLTINIDHEESKVLVGGYIQILDDNDNLVKVTQYIDQFLLL